MMMMGGERDMVECGDKGSKRREMKFHDGGAWGGIGAPTLSMGRNPDFGHSSSPFVLHNQQKTHFIAIPTTKNVK